MVRRGGGSGEGFGEGGGGGLGGIRERQKSKIN